MITAINVRKIKIFLYCIALSVGTGLLSRFITKDSYDFYSNLVLPPFAPTSQVFGLVWGILYVLMGIALFIVVKDGFSKPGVKEAFKIFVLNLILLFFWPIIFFNFNLIFFSVIWIIITLIVSLMLMLSFFEINKLSGILIIPLAIWVLFATVLNVAIWWLN